jgi:hypothetical protein
MNYSNEVINKKVKKISKKLYNFIFIIYELKVKIIQKKLYV